jgi:endonuclease/exonuclease/phosphatase family metal-dependent hydrolase
VTKVDFELPFDMSHINRVVFAVATSIVTGGAGATPPPLPGAVVKVMSYNIKHGECPQTGLDLAAVADVIDDVDPHLACLQEVDNNAIRSNNVDQAAWLAANTNLSHYAYVPTGTYDEINAEPYVSRWPDGPQLYEDTIGVDGERGIAVLSRHPIVSTEVIDFEGNIHPRALLKVKVQAPDGLVGFVCSHFPTDTIHRQPMADWLVDNAPTTFRVFIAGDFNAVPGSVEIDTLEAVWGNPTAAAPLFTFSRLNPHKQLDYVMGKNIGELFTDAWVFTAFQPSDHRPLITEWTLPAP